MIDSAKVIRFFKYAIPILVIAWFIASLIRSNPESYQGVLRNFKNEKKLFINDFLENEVDGRFDGSGISDLCAGTKWSRNLVLSCDAPAGGLGFVKNSHLNCIRFAIEMGAGLILPGIIKRSADISRLVPGDPKGSNKFEPLDYFWDADHLNQTLSTYCPQMKVYRSRNELWDVPSLLTSFGMSLPELNAPLVNDSIIANVALFHELMAKYIETKSPVAQRKVPVRFNMAPTYYAWPTGSDNVTFAKNFGRILRTRDDVRRLAATALFSLQKRFRLNLDPRKGIKRESFVGIHLRTEVDVGESFPAYEEQAANYLDYVTKYKSPVVFLATGAALSNITAFTERADDFSVTVVTKRDLLDPAEQDALDRLSYDQRALVDYEIMLRAGLVAGPSQSAFAWNLAVRRANAYGHKGNSTPSNEKMQWQDEYSTIFGHTAQGATIQATIWP